MSLYVGLSRQNLQSNYYMYVHRTKGNHFKVLKEKMIEIIQWIENFNKVNLLKKDQVKIL